ncbi:MAG: hypothetical protein IPK60_25535 [Sandaracinaceae bacterium]|nr:hypothetical protein [Sandaracinaceae bacterium]
MKASNTEPYPPLPGWADVFGSSVALSADGNLLAVGAWGEGSFRTGVGSGAYVLEGQTTDIGAAYTFKRAGVTWTQEAYIKSSRVGQDQFGRNVAVSADGNTIAVGAWQEDSNATGINGDEVDTSAVNNGAVYVFIAQ